MVHFRRGFLIGVLGSASFVAAFCNPRPVPPPQPAQDAAPTNIDAAPAPPSGTRYERACDNAARLGCPEGKRVNCPGVLEHAAVTRITPVDVACSVAAKDVAGIRKCGAFFRCE